MKKLKYLLLLLLLLMIPYFVKAYIPARNFADTIKLKYVVINQNGTNLLDSNLNKVSTLAYKEEVSVIGFEEIDGKKYAYIIDDDTYEDYYVNIDSLDFKSEEYIYNEDNYASSNAEKVLFYKKNIKLKKGPSDLYDNYDYNIPVGSIFDVENEVNIFPLKVDSDEDEDGENWYYVTNGTQKGWVKIDSVASNYKGWKEMWILNDVQAYSDPELKSKVSGVTIPKDTKFEIPFSISTTFGDELISSFLVNYNGKYVWINSKYVVVNFVDEGEYYFGAAAGLWHTKNVISAKSIKAYKNYNDKNSNVTIPQNTEIEILYVGESTKDYVKYGDNYAWVGAYGDVANAKSNYYVTAKKLDLYDSYKGKVVSQLPKDNKLEALYAADDEIWEVTKIDDKIYWIKNEGEALVLDEEKYTDEELEDDEYIEDDEKLEENEELEEEEEEVQNKFLLTEKELILVCVGGVLVLIIIILLIIKAKNKKKPNNTEPVRENTEEIKVEETNNNVENITSPVEATGETNNVENIEEVKTEETTINEEKVESPVSEKEESTLE